MTAQKQDKGKRERKAPSRHEVCRTGSSISHQQRLGHENDLEKFHTAEPRGRRQQVALNNNNTFFCRHRIDERTASIDRRAPTTNDSLSILASPASSSAAPGHVSEECVISLTTDKYDRGLLPSEAPLSGAAFPTLHDVTCSRSRGPAEPRNKSKQKNVCMYRARKIRHDTSSRVKEAVKQSTKF